MIESVLGFEAQLQAHSSCTLESKNCLAIDKSLVNEVGVRMEPVVVQRCPECMGGNLDNLGIGEVVIHPITVAPVLRSGLPTSSAVCGHKWAMMCAIRSKEAQRAARVELQMPLVFQPPIIASNTRGMLPRSALPRPMGKS